MTVVGTPYYMSPEVCKSEPYSAKSDVWALGCILYELCTLKKAFEADNLLGLVYKIVMDPVKPLEKELGFSDEMQSLINLLLQKDPIKRPSIHEILKMDMVKSKMRDFVKQKGQTRDVCTIVKKN